MKPRSRLPVYAARRFALRGLALLCLAFLAVSWVAVRQLQGMAVQEAEGRARLVADGMAQQVQHAVQVGVPLSQLVGVTALFEHRLQAFDDLLAVSLQDSREQVLHQRARGQANAATLAAQAPVTVSGVPVARIRVLWREPATGTLLMHWALPLAALLAFTGALAAEGLRYSLAGEVLRRERIVAAACSRLGAGDFAFRLPRLGRREFDARLPWLRAQLRHANEQFERLQRLTQSLRRTEPDQTKRALLDEGLTRVEGRDRYAQMPSLVLSDLPSQAARARWRGLWLGLAAWLLALAGAGLQSPGVLALGPGLLVLLALLAARRPGGRGRAIWLGLLLGGAALGPGLCLLALQVWAPQTVGPLGDWGRAALAFCALVAAALPWLPTPGRQSARGSDAA
ncbi:hypothetical protein [Comamonas sp. NLF-1-9]|uniref:hypothetical protein n=1 Tax=Comamonas sp. NLF-1-9 TaxID=2853163 RepID=UPI001C4798BB|nr:hypothetical protein [Comamonas sp. NLF-1-9]QXL83639.1 hypothetical protein KUD94_10310 [Comamonas sp. NLF-1-9]